MTTPEKPNIRSLFPAELEERITGMGQPKYRAGQLFSWLSRPVGDWEALTNLPRPLRQQLAEHYRLYAPVPERKQVSKIDGTVKYLWKLWDGNCVESVVMRYEHGNTICVSCQVGCRMGCAFCASTLGGRIRDLDAGEILEQVIFSQADSGLEISNIVMMGIGEPLDNYDQVLRFLRLVNDPGGMNIGMRHISLSTCGLTRGIDKLASEKLQLTLSVSLHAPDDETRSQIMPVNRSCGVEKLLETCRRYYDATGRRISFEYAMISGVNDTPAHAKRLVSALRGTGSHVNIILLNHVEESGLLPSTDGAVKTFIDLLRQGGLNVTIRRRLGSDISASCGQLRRQAAGEA